MGKTIAILGANGVYARHLIPRLVARGHSVRAIVRRPEAAGAARAAGADLRVADIFDRQALLAALAGCDVGVNLATALPGPSGRGSYEANDRVRREGTAVWVAACKQQGIAQLLQQSIGMVSPTAGEAFADEESPTALPEDPIAASAIEATLIMEQCVRDSGLDYAILRGGLFYGPGTGFDDDWRERAQAGKLRLPGDGNGYVSLVHIADMASATAAAIERWPTRRTLIVTDDRPVQWRELFTYIARSVGGSEPAAGGRLGFPSFRLRNRRARETLRWEPFYTDYRAGLSR